jgi:hypothetical protein
MRSGRSAQEKEAGGRWGLRQKTGAVVTDAYVSDVPGGKESGKGGDEEGCREERAEVADAFSQKGCSVESRRMAARSVWIL